MSKFHINPKIGGGQAHSSNKNIVKSILKIMFVAVLICLAQNINKVYAYDIEQAYDSTQNRLSESNEDQADGGTYTSVKTGSRKDSTGAYPTAAYDIKFKGLWTSFHASSKDVANADNTWRRHGAGGYFTAYRYEDEKTWYWSSSYDWRNVYISHQLIRVDNNTLVVQYTIHNNDNYAHQLDVAGNVDTMLGDNDFIPCYQETRAGIKGIRIEGRASGEDRKYYMIFDPTNYYVKTYSTDGTPAASYYGNFYVKATNYAINFNSYTEVTWDTTGSAGEGNPFSDTGAAWCWSNVYVPAHSTKSMAYVFTAVEAQKQFELDVNSAYYNWNTDTNSWEWKTEWSSFSKCKFKLNNSDWLTDYDTYLDFGTQYTIKADAIDNWNIITIADSDWSNGIPSNQEDKTTYTNNLTGKTSKYIFVQPNQYKINFNTNKPSVAANDVSLDIASKSVYYTGPYGDLPTPSLTGYTFKGWYTEASGGTQKTSSSILDSAEDITLYAHWEPNQYTLTFNSGTGVLKNPGDNLYNKNPANSVPVTYDYGYYCYMSNDIPIKTGYTFSGWFRDDNNYEQIFDEKGNAVRWSTSCYKYKSNTNEWAWQNTRDVTITAHYTPNIYIITLDSNKPTKSTNSLIKHMDIVKATYDAKVPSDLFDSNKQPSIEGWTFKGWFTQPEGGIKISVDTIYNWTASNTTLYAHWEENKYTIILDNGTSDYYKPLLNVSQPTGWSIDSLKNLYKTVNYEDEVEIKTAESYYSVTDFICDGWYSDTSWNQNTKNWTISSDSSKKVKKLVSSNNGTIRVCALWKENTAPELKLNTLDENKYRTYYEGQQITKEMLTQDDKGYTNILMSDTSLGTDKTNSNPDILNIKDTITFEFNTSAGDKFTWSKWNSNNESYKLKTTDKNSTYTVKIYAYDSGRVEVPEWFSNKKTYTTSDGKKVYYKETNKRKTNELVYSGNVNYNNYPNINTNVKKIYRSENNIATLEELKKFILDYQTTSDIEDNSDSSYWWNKTEATKKLKESLTVISTDNELNQILEVINRKDLSTGLQQVVKVKVTDQFGKETVTRVNLIILDNHDTDMIESSEQNRLRYLPVGLSNTLTYTIDNVLNSDDFSSDTIKKQTIKNSLNNKQNGSIQYIDSYGNITILEY